MRKLFVLAIALTFALFMASCGGGGEQETTGQMEEQPAETMPSGGYMAMEVTDGGSIKGKVTFAGEIPQMQKLEVTKDVNVCGKVDHYKKDLVVASDKGLANVVVSIKGIDKGKAISTMGEQFELDQNGCTFIPHVAMVPVEKELTILNSDGILHNIHTFSTANEAFNKAQPPYLKKIVQTFSEPEVIQVKCDVHAWMSGYIVVCEHPYYVVSDDMGNFELANVPAGTYTVEYWQESLGTKTMEVTVPAGGEADGSIEFSMSSAQSEISDKLASLF